MNPIRICAPVRCDKQVRYTQFTSNQNRGYRLQCDDVLFLALVESRDAFDDRVVRLSGT